jgi:SH3 domain-containing protein
MARMRTFALLFTLVFTSLCALAQEQAFTNRSTELKERAAPEAKTLATLPEGTAVKVVARGGGWTRIDASGQQGWVRVFHLRFPATVEAPSGSTAGSTLAGLGSALGFGKPATKAPLATTGVRGLSPEDLKNAEPNPEALRKLQSYRADNANAERFAREAKLSAVPIDEGAVR